MKNSVLSIFIIFAFCAGLYASVNFSSRTSRLLERGTVTELLGNVRIDSPGIILTADRALSNNNTGVVEAHSKIEVFLSSDTWNVHSNCEEVVADINRKNITMKKNVKTVFRSMEMTEESESIIIYADEATADYAEDKRAVFTGNVEAHKEDIKIFADKAEYSRTEGSIIFSGNPHAVSMDPENASEYRGDIISVSIDDEKMEIRGNANAAVFLKEEFVP
ncbi:MAG: hypothetical protein JXJ19_01915 [Elusimicrobia bacterium]|nr:hypothetical protein [Elusimicrobiota bacterium]